MFVSSVAMSTHCHAITQAVKLRVDTRGKKEEQE